MLEPIENEPDRYLIMREGEQPPGFPWGQILLGATVCLESEIPVTYDDDIVGMATGFERRNSNELSMVVRVLHEELLKGHTLDEMDAGFFVSHLQHEVKDGVSQLTYGRVRGLTLLPPSPRAVID